MRILNRFIIILTIIFLILSNSVIYASMADYTDEQADEITKQNKEEWKQNQEERINKSSNNYLKSLSVEKYKITPKFDKQTINYEIEQEVTEDYITINTETDDEKSSVSGDGKITLNSGDNNLRIDVTAENGTVRTYFIKVIKKINKNNILTSIELKNENNDSIEYTPEFNKNIFEYTCNIENYINKINIEAKTENKLSKIDITGNENLHEGLNEIIIGVTLGNQKTIYKINAYKKENNSVLNEENKIDDKLIMMIAVILIIVFLIGISIKKKHRMAGKHG